MMMMTVLLAPPSFRAPDDFSVIGKMVNGYSADLQSCDAHKGDHKTDVIADKDAHGKSGPDAINGHSHSRSLIK